MLIGRLCSFPPAGGRTCGSSCVDLGQPQPLHNRQRLHAEVPARVGGVGLEGVRRMRRLRFCRSRHPVVRVRLDGVRRKRSLRFLRSKPTSGRATDLGAEQVEPGQQFQRFPAEVRELVIPDRPRSAPVVT
jgi:hypothetical protein